MAPPRVDVAVIGGGPAGAAAALALAAHAPALRVTVIEASTYDTPRIGETLHPSVRPVLERLGVWERFASEASTGHSDACGTVSAWGSAALAGQDFITSTLGRGFHIDRRRFDALLIDEAEAKGARVIRGSRVVKTQHEGGTIRLELRDESESERAIEASFVVDATGRRARIASALGARRIFFDHLVAAALFFDVEESSFSDTRTLVEAVESGWWYSARLPGQGAIVALMTDGDIAARLRLREPEAWHAALEASDHTRSRLASARARGAPILYPADSSALDLAADDGWMAIGDAAISFDPLSGQGILKALHHGFLAAYAASDHLAGRPYAKERFRARIKGELEGYLAARGRYYREEARFPASEFWRRRSAP